MLRWLIGIMVGEIICESSNWQQKQRLKITILGANWHLFRLERIAKFSCFIMSTQNIKFYWFVIKRKKFLLPIWWYNKGLFPLGNRYFGVSVLNGLKTDVHDKQFCDTETSGTMLSPFTIPISSVESQKGVIAAQRRSVENQKGAIAVHNSALLVLNGTSLICNNTLLALNWRYAVSVNANTNCQ